ncbi:hypothetical protein BCUN_2239 [Bifidobacterium cuniculi]|uniref:Uncharacterized protein n=1 Tax=Bifidobacterium cuniculi TaxID=1688 RepID=A0A087AC34_9BIFI|nr:hypothetical protein BCUN_2239 [Bifidobacterium cuniculi]
MAPAAVPSTAGVAPPPDTFEATAGTIVRIMAGSMTTTMIVSVSVIAWLSSPLPAVTMIAEPVAMTRAAIGLYSRNATRVPSTLPNDWRPCSFQLIAANTGATPTRIGSMPARR